MIVLWSFRECTFFKKSICPQKLNDIHSRTRCRVNVLQDYVRWTWDASNEAGFAKSYCTVSEDAVCIHYKWIYVLFSRNANHVSIADSPCDFLQDKRLGGLDLESLWATASSAKQQKQQSAQRAVAKTRTASKPSKLRAAMEREEMATKEASRKLPRSERDNASFPRCTLIYCDLVS